MVDNRVVQIFVSHTKNDEDFCDKFDRIIARVGIKAFRSEFENIIPPHHKTIMNAMNNSIALFLLVGKEMVNNQKLGGIEWEYTQNWIAYEIGLASQKGIDVWAVCDDVTINFPMPYINNYFTISIRRKDAFEYMRYILNEYIQGRNFATPYIQSNGKNLFFRCPYPNCQMEFNLHAYFKKGERLNCPQCLNEIVIIKGNDDNDIVISEK
jgi:hypothetical protein